MLMQSKGKDEVVAVSLSEYVPDVIHIQDMQNGFVFLLERRENNSRTDCKSLAD